MSQFNSLDDDGEPGYTPSWFRLINDPVTKTQSHSFTQEYWDCKSKQDWSRCPDIY